MRFLATLLPALGVFFIACAVGDASFLPDNAPSQDVPSLRYVYPPPEFTFERIKALRELLLKREYEELDHRLRKIQEEFESDHTKEFNTYLGNSIFVAADPSLEPLLEEWAATMPGAYTAHLARGIYLEEKGWRAREGRYIHLTLDEQLAEMEEHFVAAKDDLVEALSINPRLPQAYASLISMDMALGNRQGCREWLDRALANDPISFISRYVYMECLEPRWGGSLAEMEEFVNESMAFVDRNPQISLLKGVFDTHWARQRLSQGRGEEALALVDRALAHGETILRLVMKADTLYTLYRNEEAIAICSRILELSPERAMAFLIRAKAHYSLGERGPAMMDLEQALSIDPAQAVVLSFRAFIHRTEQRYEEATRDLETALAVQPYSRMLWAAKGQLFIDMERYDSAEKAFQRALVLNPEFAETQYYLGLLMKKRGEAEGDKFLRSALYLDEDGFYHAELGSRYDRGSLVEENQTLAMHWLVKAAQMGNRYAESETGRRFLMGEGTPKDYRAARYWLLSAAERGERTAMNHVGLMYERGLEVYQDHNKAAHWYWKSAKAGNIHGRYNLGTVYESGLGVGKDLITAYLLTKAAASEDDEDAVKFLPRIQAQMTREQLTDAERRLSDGETGLEKALAEPEPSLDPSRHKIEDMAPPKGTKTTTDQIAFLRLTTGQWQLWIMGPDGSGARQLTHLPIDKVHAAWRPGTSEILYGTAGGHNYLLDVTSGEERPVLEGLSTKKVSWSPDGNRLAYVIRSDSRPKKDLWITDVEGRHRKEVLTNVNIEAPPAWLNDDVLIHEENATYMNVGEKNQLWELAMHLDGAQRRVPYDEEPLKLDLDVVSVPNEWSDTGSTWKLAYTSLRSGFYEIWAYDLLGKWPRQITRLQAYAGAPSWSPDGRFLAFDSDKTGTLQVYRVSENGEELVQLTKGEAPSTQPTWSR